MQIPIGSKYFTTVCISGDHINTSDHIITGTTILNLTYWV